MGDVCPDFIFIEFLPALICALCVGELLVRVRVISNTSIAVCNLGYIFIKMIFVKVIYFVKVSSN